MVHKVDAIMIDKKIGDNGSSWIHSTVANGFLTLYANKVLSYEKDDVVNVCENDANNMNDDVICLYIGYRPQPIYLSVENLNTKGKVLENFPIYENEECWAQASVSSQYQVFGFISKSPR
jgi:hypothetical protein